MGVAGAVVVQQLQDGVVDPGLALRKVLLRRAGWERKDNRVVICRLQRKTDIDAYRGQREV